MTIPIGRPACDRNCLLCRAWVPTASGTPKALKEGFALLQKSHPVVDSTASMRTLLAFRLSKKILQSVRAMPKWVPKKWAEP